MRKDYTVTHSMGCYYIDFQKFKYIVDDFGDLQCYSLNAWMETICGADLLGA